MLELLGGGVLGGIVLGAMLEAWFRRLHLRLKRDPGTMRFSVLSKADESGEYVVGIKLIQNDDCVIMTSVQLRDVVKRAAAGGVIKVAGGAVEVLKTKQGE